MLKPRCNCGRLLADIQLEYEEKIEKLKKENKENFKEEAAKLLDYFELKRYCCRTQLLGYTDLTYIII